MIILEQNFFSQSAIDLAQSLLGKIIRVRYQHHWLSANIIETEAYELTDKASHASLGYTPKRAALFMPAGTIYMYYARGKDSLNVSAEGPGNAVLIKSAFPYPSNDESMIALMQTLNPKPIHQLCKGQTLLCKSLNLKVIDWDQKNFHPEHFYFADVFYYPKKIIQTKRLGIPSGRDEHLLYRFIDYDYVKYATQNPLTKKSWCEGVDYLCKEKI